MPKKSDRSSSDGEEDDGKVVPSDEMNEAAGSGRNDATNTPAAPTEISPATRQVEEIHDDGAPLRPSDVASAKVAKYEQDEKKPSAKGSKGGKKKGGRSKIQQRGLELADDADSGIPYPAPRNASLLETTKVPAGERTHLSNSTRRPVGVEEIQDYSDAAPLPPAAVAAGPLDDAAILEKIRNNESKTNEDGEEEMRQVELIDDDGEGPPTPVTGDDFQLKKPSSLSSSIKKKKPPSSASGINNNNSSTLNSSLIVDTNISPPLRHGESHELYAQVSVSNPNDGLLHADIASAQQAFPAFVVPPEPRETVYEGEAVDPDEDDVYDEFDQAQQNNNFQRRNRIMIATVTILVAGIIAAVAGALVATGDDGNDNPTPSVNTDLTPSPTMMPTVRPPLNCTVTYNGPMYENDCKPYSCNHVVERDGNLMTMYRDRASEIQYLSANSGSLEMIANHTYEHEADDMIFKPGSFFVSSPYSRDGYGVVKISPRDLSGAILLDETVTISPIDERVRFGTSIDVDWNVLAVGVPDDNDYAGSVYIYRESDSLVWVEEDRLIPNDPSAQLFGNSVLVKGNLLVVAARGGGVGEVGKVFFYEFDPSSNAWTPLEDYTLVNEDCDGDFGASLAFTANNGLLVGCPLENVYQRATGKEASSAGVVYYYQREEDGNGQYKLVQNVTVTNGKSLEKFSGNHHHIATNEKGDVALIGTYGRLGGKDEKVYAFVNVDNVWSQVAEMHVQNTMWFGEDVVMGGDQILIGSWENVHSYSMSCVEWNEPLIPNTDSKI